EDANRHTLIRRATCDLLGLPPTPEEVDAFVADTAPDAYERLIDRLLDRPEYGERWGRHWLDVAGYADSDGYTASDPVRAYTYKYRDYVIQALNHDMPIDEFICEQIAGDEMIGYPTKTLAPAQVEKLVATGFLRMAPDGTAASDVDQNVARNQVISDTIKIVSTSILGLTVGCAECHDHKYDPIPQADYYRLRAIFEPALDWKSWRVPKARLVSLASDEDRRQTAALEAEAAKVDKERKRLEDILIERTFEEVLAKVPENLHSAIREAFNTTPAKRTPAQKKLLKENPSVNVSAGSLYLYDRPRQAALRASEKKLASQKAELEKAPSDEGREAVEATEGQIAGLRAGIATLQLAALSKQAADIRSRKPVQDFVHALSEIPGKVPQTFVFHRGDYAQPKQTVEPGEPTVFASAKSLASEKAAKSKSSTTGRRMAWAARLTDGTHPLVARVLVNRVWLNHFGRGLVATPSDFGVLGERPSHPELLDWLASDFMEGGWRLKRFHRLLMTSSVYRQASRHRADQDALDPDNRLLARMNVRRAEAEAIRDTILAVTGKLNPKAFGPPVPVMPDEVGQVVIGVDTRDTAGRPTGKSGSVGDEEFRRSVYVQVRRSMPLGMLESFDAPTMTTACNCESRSTSTVAPQSLILMNSQFLLDQASYFVERLKREAPENLKEQVRRAWRLAYGRDASSGEVEEAIAFVSAQSKNFDAKGKVPPTIRALANLCQALLSSNEFLYID
ncbi:MAG TPA: DUF1549 and DUF1553 domain-containing protein, partial [Pirellulales bacterium]|nr:DUF1549 and DUF1553 domain-containing protein [Pirellulales bacterium]